MWAYRGCALFGLVASRLILWQAYRQTPLPFSPFGDPLIYANLARGFAEGKAWPLEVIFRSPLYTYIVGLFFKVFGASPIPVIIFQNLVGILGGMLLLELLWRVGGAKRSPYWVGLVLLLQSGVWVVYEWKLFPVSLAVSLEIAILFFVWMLAESKASVQDAPSDSPGVSRKHLLPLAIALSTVLLVLLRPNFLLFLVFLVAWGLLPATRKRFGGQVALYLVIVPALLFAPIMSRNYKMGAGLGLTANSGITFYHGNNPRARGGYAVVPGVSPDVLLQNRDVLQLARQHGAMTPSAANRYWMNKGWHFLFQDPMASAKLVARKFIGFISPWEAGGDMPWKFEKYLMPRVRLFSLVNFSFLLFFALFGVRQLWRAQPTFVLLGGGLFFASLLTCLIFYMNNRYRLPAWPILIVPAAFGIVGGFEQIAKIKKGRGLQRGLPAFAKIAAGLALVVWTVPVTLQPFEKIIGWHNLGVASARAGMTEEAIAAYDHVLAIDPDHGPTLRNLSGLYLANGALEKAEEKAVALVRDTPTSHLGYISLAEVYFRQRKFDKAKEAAQQALKRRPENIKAGTIFANASYILEEYEVACPLIARLVKLSAGDTLLRAFHSSCPKVLARQRP